MFEINRITSNKHLGSTEIGGPILICSCSTLLISFENDKISFVFYGEHEYMNIAPLPITVTPEKSIELGKNNAIISCSGSVTSPSSNFAVHSIPYVV